MTPSPFVSEVLHLGGGELRLAQQLLSGPRFVVFSKTYAAAVSLRDANYSERLRLRQAERELGKGLVLGFLGAILYASALLLPTSNSGENTYDPVHRSGDFE